MIKTRRRGFATEDTMITEEQREVLTTDYTDKHGCFLPDLLHVFGISGCSD